MPESPPRANETFATFLLFGVIERMESGEVWDEECLAALTQTADVVAMMADQIKYLERDIDDMNQSPQTIFVRCGGCGRLRSRGIICPTNVENYGTCPSGL